MAKQKLTAADFGYGDAFLKDPANKAIKDLVDRAIKQTWTETRLEAAIKNTQWWKKRSTSQRAWDQQKATDPGQTKAQTEARIAFITQQAAALGVDVDAEEARKIAVRSLRNGQDEQQVRYQIAGRFGSDDAEDLTGQAEVTVDQMAALAAQFGIPQSPNGNVRWTREILQGTQSVDTYQSYLRDQAKVNFPAMASYLDDGLTVADVAEPFKQLAVKRLGINPADFDLGDPKWSGLLADAADPTKMASFDQVDKTLKIDPRFGYGNSKAAIADASDLAAGIAQGWKL